MRSVRLSIAATIALTLFVTLPIFADPLGSAITYQGRLKNAGSPANGPHTMEFRLFDVPAGGTPVAPILVFDGVSNSQVAVANGLFTVELDFTAASYNGDKRWLDITVNATPLVPRQELTPAPYARFSAAPWATNGNNISNTNTANVGVGTASPDARLHVSGAVKIADGTQAAGKVLTSDANGLATWQSAAGDATSASNGLTKVGNDIRLGGTLTAATNIDQAGFNLTTTNGRIGIGSAAAPASPLHVVTITSNLNAMRGENTAASGTSTGSGVVGITSQSGAAGVRAENKHATGTGLIATGNNVGAAVLPTGSGSSFSGFNTGVYARGTSPGTGQAGYFDMFGDIVRVAYYDGAISYKINGVGSVATIVRDVNANPVNMFCPESPEVLFIDYGHARLLNGFAHVGLDPTFAQNVTINEEHPLRVFIQLEDDENCRGVVVKKKTPKGFDVVELNGGQSNTPFQYQLVCNRADELLTKGRISRNSSVRFPPAPTPEPLNDAEKPGGVR